MKINERAFSAITLLVLAMLIAAGCCGPPPAPTNYTPQPSEHIVNASDADFDEVVLSADKPVLVDFWASWCDPCAMLDPTVVKLAEEFHEEVKFVRVNADDSPKYGRLFASRGLPTLALIYDGVLVENQIGVVPEELLREWLVEQLARIEDRN
jgi:thioredoxin 1